MIIFDIYEFDCLEKRKGYIVTVAQCAGRGKVLF